MESICYAQQNTIPDTLVLNDSDLDSPIYYGALDSIYKDPRKKQVHLVNKAYVDDGTIELKAGYILIDLKKNEVLATYRLDEDSNEVELPVFTDGADEAKIY